MLREGQTTEELIADKVLRRKWWEPDEHLCIEVMRRVRFAVKRAEKDGLIEQGFGVDGAFWRSVGV